MTPAAEYRGLAKANPKAILERYLDGENSTQIAQSFGVTKQRLSFWLIKHSEEEWKQVQVVKAIELKDDALDLMNVEKTARDAVDLAYAREKLKAAQWDLERVCKRIYGQDQPLNDVLAGLVINIGLRRGRVIEAEPVVLDTPNGAVHSNITDKTA